ncbi:MAG: AsmA-like C-terminal region-containing protein [Vicinamibacterales bacterium]
MFKKAIIGVLVLFLALTAGLFLWARAVLTEDTVRTALASQVSNALGQPVTVGHIEAAIYPRVSVILGDVTIGEPARIRIDSLRIGTDFRALLSRRIEHATLELSGAHIELPLPALSLGTGSADESAAAPVELVSIDSIALHGVEIVSGPHTLTGDVELVPKGNGVTVQRMTLGADGQRVDITGQITDLAGPVGALTLTSEALNFDRLLAVAGDVTANSGLASPSSASSSSTAPAAGASNGAAAAGSSPPMNLAISLDAKTATMGALMLDGLKGTARLSPSAMTIEPMEFGVFGGRYVGSIAFALAEVPGFTLNATLSDVDMAAATAFAGSPGVVTGRLSAKLAMAGRGMDAATVLDSARGTARLDVTNGVVKNLGLVRTLVIATSGRADNTAAELGSKDEAFTRLGTTLQIARGSAATQDLRFESTNLLLSAAGVIALDGSRLDLAGDMQLSDALSQRAGRDLARYTAKDGRVTIPVTITGTADAPQVHLDLADMAKRALTNRANEEAQKAIKERLGGLFRR